MSVATGSPHQADRIFRFGPFELSERDGELRKNGVRIKLQEQPFRVLVELVANAGRVVSREELQQKLWSADTFVDFDVGLNTAIRKLRQALNDDADHPHYIETLAKRGYRFIAPVADVVRAAPRPTSRDSPARCFGLDVRATVRVLRHPKKFSARRDGGIGSWRQGACWRCGLRGAASMAASKCSPTSGDRAADHGESTRSADQCSRGISRWQVCRLCRYHRRVHPAH